MATCRSFLLLVMLFAFGAPASAADAAGAATAGPDPMAGRKACPRRPITRK